MFDLLFIFINDIILDTMLINYQVYYHIGYIFMAIFTAVWYHTNMTCAMIFMPIGYYLAYVINDLIN